MPAWTIPYSKSGVFPMPALTKSTSFQTLETFQTMYYARKKLPDPAIINTAQHTYFRIDFQRPYTLDRFCSRYMYGMAYEMA